MKHRQIKEKLYFARRSINQNGGRWDKISHQPCLFRCRRTFTITFRLNGKLRHDPWMMRACVYMCVCRRRCHRRSCRRSRSRSHSHSRSSRKRSRSRTYLRTGFCALRGTWALSARHRSVKTVGYARRAKRDTLIANWSREMSPFWLAPPCFRQIAGGNAKYSYEEVSPMLF